MSIDPRLQRLIDFEFVNMLQVQFYLQLRASKHADGMDLKLLKISRLGLTVVWTVFCMESFSDA